MNIHRVGCILLIAAGVGALATGCSTSGDASGDVAEADAKLGTVSMQLVENPDFKGNSVVVCGKRKEKSDGKYPCVDEFCRCLDFGSDGKTEKSTRVHGSASFVLSGMPLRRRGERARSSFSSSSVRRPPRGLTGTPA